MDFLVNLILILEDALMMMGIIFMKTIRNYCFRYISNLEMSLLLATISMFLSIATG